MVMGKQYKVLAVDDNHVNCLLIKRILGGNAEVSTASNGLEAVEKIAKNSYDLVLMDLQMPVMDGFDATVLIRKNNYQKPILALSAIINPENIVKCKESGMNDFLQKPYQRKQLVALVDKWMPD